MSAGVVLVDDHLLLRLLLGHEPSELRPNGAAIFTTGLWYHRLCRALRDQTVTGAMSKSLGNVDAHIASEVVRSVIDLPPSIGLTSLRSLGWRMADLVASGARLNLLSLEALAAAEHLGAEICLATADDNPPLRQAADHRGAALRLVGG